MSNGQPVVDINGLVTCEEEEVEGYARPKGISPDGSIVEDSDAVRACKAINGKLPTKAQFEQLLKHWENEDLVPHDFKEPMMYGKRFWTSSVNTYREYYHKDRYDYFHAWAFQSIVSGLVDTPVYSLWGPGVAVRCVAP